MPRPRFERASPEKREAILDAAAREFASYGYDDASINRILLAAGFSKGAFYYYFDEKADLAAAVLEREAVVYLELWSKLKTPRTRPEFWTELERFGEISSAQLHKQNATALDAMTRLSAAFPQHPELLEWVKSASVKEATAKVMAFWKVGQKLGAVRTDLTVAQIIAMQQDLKLALVKFLLPTGRAASVKEMEHYGEVLTDWVRRSFERK